MPSVNKLLLEPLWTKIYDGIMFHSQLQATGGNPGVGPTFIENWQVQIWELRNHHVSKKIGFPKGYVLYSCKMKQTVELNN